MRRQLPIAAGGALALASAALFGAATPLVQRFGRGVGPLTTAAALYAGAAIFSAGLRRTHDAALARKDFARVVVVALLGAAVAPAALAWGLQRTSGVIASLLLNLEALFTVVLSWIVVREPLGRRVIVALAAMLVGGVLLILQGRSASVEMSWGALAVAGATLAWAGDNVLGRPLAERDPAQVIFAKSSLGAGLSLGLAALLKEPWPSGGALLALATCGAVGYGASLRFYLRAQRRIGAARTGSIFAATPFLGALLAWALGERTGGAWTMVAGAFCAAGVILHLTERHEHPHTHQAIEHDHVHRHDDGHHDHTHEDPPEGEHSHPHRHDALVHTHPHAPDLHHRHGH
jgi:drug/metabolite transporter (DMT)-like permease